MTYFLLSIVSEPCSFTKNREIEIENGRVSIFYQIYLKVQYASILVENIIKLLRRYLLNIEC